MSRHATLTPMNPIEQLKAGRLPRRLSQLFVGLVMFGVSMGLMIRAQLGLDPWDVFHVGLANRVGLSIGTIVIVTGALILLLWIPLKQWPSLGTIANTVVIGLATDATLSAVPPISGWVPQFAMLIAGIALNGLASALYVGSQFGAGPRDGLSTGLSHRFGWKLRWVRMSIELIVLAVGWLMGGVVGIGTVLYALAIGPLWHALLPWFIVEVAPPRSRPDASTPVGDTVGCDAAQ